MKTKFFLLCLLLAISANAQIVYHDASEGVSKLPI